MTGDGIKNARDFVRFEGAINEVPEEVDKLQLDVARLKLPKATETEVETFGPAPEPKE